MWLNTSDKMGDPVKYSLSLLLALSLSLQSEVMHYIYLKQAY